MNILITAGGTIEPIDKVRDIVNKSTGVLGAKIALSFLSRKNTCIDYVYGGELLVNHPKLNPIKITDFKSVDKIVTEILTQKKIDIFIHAMAVSDFSIQGVVNIKQALNNAAEKIANRALPLKTIVEILTLEFSPALIEEKLSSEEDIALILSKNEKIIAKVKSLQPNTVLVGFKLTVNEENEALYKKGCEFMEKNNCDFVFANDLKNICAVHRGILIDKNKKAIELVTKENIAEAIVKSTLRTRIQKI